MFEKYSFQMGMKNCYFFTFEDYIFEIKNDDKYLNLEQEFARNPYNLK